MLRSNNLIGFGASTPLPSGGALLVDLISYWEMNESSGNAIDSHGSNDLTNSGSISSATGLVGGCRENPFASPNYLSHVPNADLDTGDVDFTVAFWFKPTSLPAYASVLGKWLNIAGDQEYILYFIDTTGVLQWIVDGSGIANVNPLSVGSWNFIVCGYNSATRKAFIKVNSEVMQVSGTAATLGWTSGSADFRLFYAQWLNPMYGQADETGFWKRLLTSDEITFLYNSGAGRSYADVAAY